LRQLSPSLKTHPTHYPLERIMEAERINLINNQLVSLTERVHELRGYL
jgi:hypothetical protein